LTLGWLPVASKNLGKGGFACAVSPDESDLVTRGHAEGHLTHEGPGTDGYLKVFDAKQSTNLSFACKSNSLQSSLHPLVRIENLMTMQLSSNAALIDRVVPRSALNSAALILSGAVFTAYAAQLVVPMWPVPFTAQTLAVLLVGSVLGATRGAISLIVYFSMGALGLPVFSAASSLSFGPTFGYLIGFVAAAAVVGWLSERGWHKSVHGVIGSFAIANSVIYLFGLPWLGYILGSLGVANDVASVAAAGLAPFIIGDVLKMIIAAALLPLAWKFLGKKA
jgi:biotin transport system substrate-specific component